MDLGPHGPGAGSGFGEAWVPGRYEPLTVMRLSEEHAIIGTPGAALAAGTRLIVLPNHACPVANLAATMTLLRNDGTAELLPVDARGGQMEP